MTNKKNPTADLITKRMGSLPKMAIAGNDMTNSIELKTSKEAMENILHGKEGKFPNFAELNDLASDALIAHDLLPIIEEIKKMKAKNSEAPIAYDEKTNAAFRHGQDYIILKIQTLIKERMGL